MTLAEPSITQLVQKLNPEAQREVRDFIEFLLVKRIRDSSVSEWPDDYFSRVIGSLPDFLDSDGVDGSNAALDDADEALRF